jgi:hypothetical protein
MPEGIDIRFPKARYFVVALQSAFAINPPLRLMEVLSNGLTRFSDFFNPSLKTGQDLLPFLLIQHGHIDLAPPAVSRLRHRCHLVESALSRERNEQYYRK